MTYSVLTSYVEIFAERFLIKDFKLAFMTESALFFEEMRESCISGELTLVSMNTSLYFRRLWLFFSLESLSSFENDRLKVDCAGDVFLSTDAVVVFVRIV